MIMYNIVDATSHITPTNTCLHLYFLKETAKNVTDWCEEQTIGLTNNRIIGNVRKLWTEFEPCIHFEESLAMKIGADHVINE